MTTKTAEGARDIAVRIWERYTGHTYEGNLIVPLMADEIVAALHTTRLATLRKAAEVAGIEEMIAPIGAEKLRCRFIREAIERLAEESTGS